MWLSLMNPITLRPVSPSISRPKPASMTRCQRLRGSSTAAPFVEPIIKELPMEYAVERNRLIELQMEGSIG